MSGSGPSPHAPEAVLRTAAPARHLGTHAPLKISWDAAAQTAFCKRCVGAVRARHVWVLASQSHVLLLDEGQQSSEVKRQR